jgi:hypothetical protein
MTTQHFPELTASSIVATRNALHAYARVLGDWLKQCRLKRKHWWHASLRPSLNGLTTGVIYADIDFELELNLRDGLLQVRTSTGEQLSEKLNGQPAAELADHMERFLVANGIDEQRISGRKDSVVSTAAHPGYSAQHARDIIQVINSVSSVMDTFRAGIREETSPIQLWPHHFDLSLLWLPGEKIAGQDPANEEYADKQMNFGFTFGDEGIPEPYFYVTAYPLPDALPNTQLPAGTSWHSEGFNGAVLLYQTLAEHSDPDTYLLALWRELLSAGREQFLINTRGGSLS